MLCSNVFRIYTGGGVEAGPGGLGDGNPQVGSMGKASVGGLERTKLKRVCECMH